MKLKQKQWEDKNWVKEDRLIELEEEKDFFRRKNVFLEDRSNNTNGKDQDPSNLKDGILKEGGGLVVIRWEEVIGTQRIMQASSQKK